MVFLKTNKANFDADIRVDIVWRLVRHLIPYASTLLHRFAIRNLAFIPKSNHIRPMNAQWKTLKIKISPKFTKISNKLCMCECFGSNNSNIVPLLQFQWT